MLKSIFYFAFIIILCTSCSQDDNADNKLFDPGPCPVACGELDPVERFEWLRKQVSVFDMRMDAQSKMIAKYQNEEFFLIEPCIQCPDALTTVVNCNRETICEFGGNDGTNSYPDFEGKAILITILYG